MRENGPYPGDQPMGATYDPATGTWRDLAEPPLSPRRDHVAVWTGDELLIWGGRVQNGRLAVLTLDGGAV
jgi:hypothetical protein